MAQPGSSTSTWWWSHRNKLLGAGAVAAASYWAYQTYGRQDGSVARLSRATRKYCDAYETTADLVSLLATDLKQFLTSDQTETPRSLQQLAKLLQREEVQQTVQTFVRSVAAAVAPPGDGGSSGISDVVDKLVAGLLSEQGRSLVGLAVAKAAKHSTAAVCDFVGQRLDAAAAAGGPAAGTADTVASVVRVLASEDGERLLRVVVGEGMTRAVDSYMSAATPDNYYDDMLGSLSRPEHTQAVKEIMGAVSGTFARELVAGFMQASSAQAQRQRQQRQADASTSYAPSADAASSASDAEEVEELHDSVQSLTPTFARCRLDEANPQWMTTVAQLSRQPEVQALAVEMTKTSVREAMGSVLQPFFGQFGSGGAGQAGMQVALGSWLQRMYTMASVMLSLLLYMCST